MKNISRGKHSIVVINERTVEKKFGASFYSNFLKEIKALSILQKYPFIPKIISFSERDLTIIIERVEGINLVSVLKKKPSRDFILKIFKVILKICFLLDIEGVYKDEWNRPFKHVILSDYIKIIDFDRSVFFTNRKNSLQFLSFVLNYFGLDKGSRNFAFVGIWNRHIEKYRNFC